MPTSPTKRWEVAEKSRPLPVAVDEELSAYPPFFRKVLYHRGICTQLQAMDYLDGMSSYSSPFDLTGIQDTVKRLEWAIKHQEHIVVYGDYDVDGVTATALMVQVLQRLGAQVSYYIPNRFDEGYGLNIEAIEKLAQQGAQVILTVDCGIRSLAEAVLAEKLDIDLIVCDHHHPSEELPAAYAVICPRQPGDAYPYKDLSGVGLAYKLAQALISSLPDCGIDLSEWLDLVALGTVADVVPLTGENRELVRQGLQVIRAAGRPGILSLAQVAGIRMEYVLKTDENGSAQYPRLVITSGDIGFMLGPRLNAAGRLETALDALRLLLAQTPEDAGLIAQQLDDQNRRRQEITRKMQDEADALAKHSGSEEILLAFDPPLMKAFWGWLPLA